MLALWTQVTFYSAVHPLARIPYPVIATYLSTILQCEIKRKPRNSIRLGPRADLQVFNDTGETLVLETGVFTLGVFTNDDKVDVLVSGGHAGEGLADDDRGVDVEGLSHGDVPRVVASDFHRGVQDTWGGVSLRFTRR